MTSREGNEMEPDRVNQKWLVIDTEKGWKLILPDPDILPHSLELEGNKREVAGIECPCAPKIDYINQLIIHNSFYDKKRIEESINNIRVN